MRARLIVAAAAFIPGHAASAQSGAPAVTRVQIAEGSFNTSSRTVNVRLTVAGDPTAFRMSERSDMSGAAWRKFTSTPAFTLSSDPGRKIVFVQVGRSPAISTTVAKISEPISTTRLSTDFVPAPTIVSPVASDTIFLGLPDLKSSVTLPAAVHDNTRFEFEVIVSNAGMPTPPNGVINVYNSFVTNTISLELVEVPFGVGRLAGKGCVITDVSTIECTLAPMVHDAAVAIQVTASVVRGLTASQTQATHTLRTRITGITESNTTNNWRDTPITIVR